MKDTSKVASRCSRGFGVQNTLLDCYNTQTLCSEAVSQHCFRMPRDPAADELDAALNASAVSGIARLLRSRLLASPIRQEDEPTMSAQQGQQSAAQAAPPAAVNLAQLDSLVRQYMVVEDIVEVSAFPGVS